MANNFIDNIKFEYIIHLEVMQKIIDTITQKETSHLVAAAKPSLSLIAGQPNSGRLEAFFLIQKSFEGNIIYIDRSLFKYYHPYYHIILKKYPILIDKILEDFTNSIYEHLIHFCIAAKFNIAIKSNFSNADTILKILSPFKAKKYLVDLHLLIVKENESILLNEILYESILQFLRLQQYTPIIELIQSNINIINTIKELNIGETFSKFHFYKREITTATFNNTTYNYSDLVKIENPQELDNKSLRSFLSELYQKQDSPEEFTHYVTQAKFALQLKLNRKTNFISKVKFEAMFKEYLK